MRGALPLAVLAGCLGIAVLPALAADGSVTVKDFSFAPSQVTVQPGEKVTWRDIGSSANHNVHFDGDGPLMAPSTTFTVEKMFPVAGTFHYHCDVHPTTMTGTVIVGDGGPAPTPTPTPTPTPSATSSSTATPGPVSDQFPVATATPAGSPGGAQPAGISRLAVRAAAAHFCTRRSAACRRPGVFLDVDLAAPEPVTARGTLRRSPLHGGRSRPAGSLRLTLSPGRHRIRLATRRPLAPGRYALALTAGALTRRAHFTVGYR